MKKFAIVMLFAIFAFPVFADTDDSDTIDVTVNVPLDMGVFIDDGQTSQSPTITWTDDSGSCSFDISITYYSNATSSDIDAEWSSTSGSGTWTPTDLTGLAAGWAQPETISTTIDGIAHADGQSLSGTLTVTISG